MKTDLKTIEITENEIWPVMGHIELTTAEGTRYNAPWNRQVAVTATELARLNRLAALENRVSRLYNRLLDRVSERDTQVHINDDGTVIILTQEKS